MVVAASEAMATTNSDSWIELLLYGSSSRSRSPRKRRCSHSRRRSECRNRRCSRSRSSRKRWPMGAELKRYLEPKEKEAEFDCNVLPSRLIEETKRMDLPIYNRLSSDPESCISSLLDSRIEYFYIGATVDPLRRWLGEGCNSTMSSTGRSMPGHSTQWNAMFLIGISSNEGGRNAARALETELIKFAKTRWPESCTNRAVDARGQCSGTNFIYMVVRRFD